MSNYQKTGVKLTNTQLNRLTSAAINNSGKILRINRKSFEGEELSHELSLTTR